MRISIITPVLNGASTIRECIESVAGQNWPTEHIIVDGGSTDSTLEIVGEYGDRLRVVSEEDRGAYDAMNKGIDLASGDVVGILNADDFFSHSRVLATVAQVLSSTRSDSCYGDLKVVDAGNKGLVRRLWCSGPYRVSRFYWGWMPPHPTFFVRRTFYERYGKFLPELGSAADYELMLRFLVRYGISAIYVQEVLVHMRTGGMSNCGLKYRIRANLMDRRAWRVNGLEPYPWTLWLKPLTKLGQFVSAKRCAEIPLL